MKNTFTTLVLSILAATAVHTAAAKSTVLEVAVARPLLQAEIVQKTYLKIGLTGAEMTRAERAPANVAIVLDRSGSMQGEKLQRAKEAAIHAIKRLGSRDIVSVIAYDDTIRVLVPATRVSDRQAIQDAILSLEAGGSTALFAGVSKGASEVRKFLDREHVNRVILLSDGLANVGPDSPSELGALGASLAKEGVSVSTIGLGLGYNEDLMTRLAARSDGNHAFVEHPRDLARIFDYELGDVLSVVAQDVVVTIRCEDGVRPIRVLGREAEIIGDRILVQLNQLYSEHEKYILVEVEVPAAPAGRKQILASVEAEYRDLMRGRDSRLVDTVFAGFSTRMADIEAAENDDVMVAVVEQIATEKSQLALALRDEGKVEQAREVLVQNQAFVQSNADQLDSIRLQELAEANEEDAKKLDEKNWAETRKRMRETQTKSKAQRRW